MTALSNIYILLTPTQKATIVAAGFASSLNVTAVGEDVIKINLFRGHYALLLNETITVTKRLPNAF